MLRTTATRFRPSSPSAAATSSCVTEAVFVEYVLLAVNDSRERAGQLAVLLDPKVFKVNLIPHNPTGMYDGSSREAIAAFKRVLDEARILSTVRLTRGREIAAACGQLAATR